MAEKIGFISFSAFDLRKANEFDAIKTRLYHADRPARSFFDIHPSQPPWRQLSLLGAEPMVRHTPAELRPLMNEYYRYFSDKSMQHEHFLRWRRRHQVWDRDGEIYYARFDDLRNYLNEMYNRQAYIHQGRMQSIFKSAAEKTWERQERFTENYEEKREKKVAMDAKLLAKKTQHLKLLQEKNVTEPDQKHLLEKSRALAKTNLDRETREALHSPGMGPPRWAQLLAIADYAQKSQMPLPPQQHHPTGEKPAVLQAPPAMQVGKIAK